MFARLTNLYLDVYIMVGLIFHTVLLSLANFRSGLLLCMLFLQLPW